MKKRKRPLGVALEPTLPPFEPRIPGTEYDTPYRTGAQAVWTRNEYTSRKLDGDAIFGFLNIQRSQKFEIIKYNFVQTRGSLVEVNPRGRPPWLDLGKKMEITYPLGVEGDAQRRTWTQLGMEVGTDARKRQFETRRKKGPQAGL